MLITLTLLSLSLPVQSDDACAACHPAVVEAYRKHGMANTLREARSGEFVSWEGQVLKDDRSGYTYSVDVRGKHAYLVEKGHNVPGFPKHRLERKIRGSVGAGLLDRSLVLEHNGRLFFAPVEISTEAGLVLAPHQELNPHTRLWNPITADCLDCHLDARPEARYPANLAEGIQLEGIGCAGCHGDPTEHLESAGERGTIADLSSLPPARQLDVCARCHLQGDARIDLRNDDDISFAPGDNLFASRAAFVPGKPDDDFGFVSASDRLSLSPCFTESHGELTCTTCHNPHTSARNLAPEVVDRACLGCHQRENCDRPEPARTEDMACVRCHMRKSAPFDLRHVSITDHFIRRNIAEPEELESIRVHASPDGELVRFRWPLPGEIVEPTPLEDEGALAMALAHLGHHDRALKLFDNVEAQGAPPVLEGLVRYHLVRGLTLEQAGRLPEAEDAYQKALSLDPTDAEAGVNLGLLQVLQNQPGARKQLERVARNYPQAEQPWRNLAVLDAKMRDATAFESALVRALEINPDLAILWLRLGTFRHSRGNIAGALQALMKAQALDPMLPGLYLPMGKVLLESGQYQQARDALMESRRRDPDNPVSEKMLRQLDER